MFMLHNFIYNILLVSVPKLLLISLINFIFNVFSEDVEVPEAKPSGVYRPPGARLTTTARRPNQGPPEIYSDTQFPSLLATAKHVETRK